MPYKCDFCNTEVKELACYWDTPEITTVAVNILTGQNETVVFEQGQWGACKECAYFINMDDWSAIEARVLKIAALKSERNVEIYKGLMHSTWPVVREAILAGKARNAN